MKFIFIVAVLFTLIYLSNQESIERLEDILVYPMEPATKRYRREIGDAKIKETKFIQFAEEKLIQHTQALERLLKETMRNGDLVNVLIDNLSKNMEEPKFPEKLESRRSMGGRPIVVSSTPEDGSSPWCQVAVLCHRTFDPVCGYDDNFGYGKFDDICHMLQVNCYWKYNFALVPTCRPVLKV